MDLKKLAWFFEDEVEACRDEFTARFAHDDAQPWLDACSNNLLRSLFAATHKVLVSQYKLIEAEVSFDDFCHSLRQSEIRNYLHARYPLLRSRIGNACTGWLEQACAIAERFQEDLGDIRARLLPGDLPLAIESVRFGLGDGHRGGRSVALLRFRDGRQLVYKPRSLAIDTHFAEMLAWANQRCGTDLWVPAHLNRGEYGWVEFVSHTACGETAEVERFYFRMGNLLALLYILEGTDFHYENVIAVGEYPVLIDLESFFHPHAGGEANAALDTSVLKAGMLPNRLAAVGHMPEISGLSDAEGQPGLESLHLAQGEDGNFSLVRGRGALLGAQNVPVLDGTKIEIQAQHAQQLKAGFERIYRAVLEDVTGFSALAEACADDQVRVLFRRTATYAHLLEEAHHPSLMASMRATADHYALLRLSESDYPASKQFVEFEIADLQRGDVPLFTTRAGSRHLWCADDVCISDFFERSGLEAVRRKLAMLSPQDLERQLWIIGNAFVAHAVRASSQARARGQLRATDTQDRTLDERLLAQAEHMGWRLREQMHVTDESASWLVHLSAALDNSEFELIPAFHDLFCGMPGEILFYSQLAQVSGRHEHRELAHKALRHLHQRLRDSSSSIQALGLYVGWGSVVHLLTALAQLESNYEHLESAETLLASSQFDELIEKDRNFSLIKGAAGFMLACSDLHIASGSQLALQLAEACANHLLAHRCTESNGYAWRVTSTVPLAGLAHGASGFALAFARLYEASGNVRYRDACLSALEYERGLFHPELGNWQDCRDIVLREYGERPWCSVAWAHGAPGIGLARLAMLRAGIDTPQIRDELDVAVRTTIEKGFDGGDSLIFGSFGNLELLVSYSECFGQEALPQIPTLIAPMLDRIERQELRLSAPASCPLGLMSGATGVAYQCLRVARMHQVPSVLCGTSRLPTGVQARASRNACSRPRDLAAEAALPTG